MLDRYRKPGGFVQLLALIETCHQPKQEKLLEIIAQEDRRWSETVRSKMLSIDRIYSWDDQALAEIFGTLQDLTVAVALHAATPELKSRVTGFFTHGRIRKIEDLLGTKGPTAAEIAATHMKIVESVRKMESDGFIRFEKIDPSLVISDDIDDDLSHPPVPGETVPLKSVSGATKPAGTASSRVLHSYSPLSEHLAAQNETSGQSTPAYTPNQSSDVNESRLMEIQTLKKRVAEMSKENAVLRHELSIARSKLDQIKKIA
jgi:hypothetical protein